MKKFFKDLARDLLIILVVTLALGVLYASDAAKKREEQRRECPKGPVKPGDSCKVPVTNH